MKLWSRGLGKRELEMDFMRYEISRDGDDIVLSGRITEPVNWDFWIRFDEEDVPGLIRVAKNPSIISLVLRRWTGKLPFLGRKKTEDVEEPEETQKPAPAAKPAAVKRQKAEEVEAEATEPVAAASRPGRDRSESQ
jgi:hypothetical protein